MADTTNPFLKNIDRTLFTFNMHNMSEICFNHVFKKKQMNEVKGGKITKEQELLVD